MSKHRNKHHTYAGAQTRQQIQAKQQKKELRDAQQNGIMQGESSEEIAKELAKEFEAKEKSAKKAAEDKPVKWYVLDTNVIISCVDIIYDKDDDTWREPINFSPKLTNAQLIIPQVVYDELDHIKDEISHRGVEARTAIKRIGNIIRNSGRTLEDIMYNREPVKTGIGKQTLSILPIHKDFAKILPWIPDYNDGWIAVTALVATLIKEGRKVDGSLQKDENFDIMKRSNEKRDVILLTNDNRLIGDANRFGVHVRSYSFDEPEPYTGCREITVPAEMFRTFYHEDGISRKEFEEYMPNEPSLVDNEYLVMTPEDDDWPRGYFSDQKSFNNVARYRKEKDMIYPLRFAKREGKVAPNEGIATYYDALNDDSIRVVNVIGSAGTGKTYQAVVHAIKEIKAGKYTQAVIIPSRAAKNPLGALPGNQDQKMEPLISSVKDAIRSYLASTPEFIKKRELLRRHGDTDNDTEDNQEVTGDGKKQKKNKGDRNDRGNNNSNRSSNSKFNNKSLRDLDPGSDLAPEDLGASHSKKKDKTYYPGKNEKKQAAGSEGKKMTYNEMLDKETNYLYNRYFISMPYEDAQGHSFDDSIIILDEFQRVKIDDADTLITRPGKGSKIIVCGDIDQIHNSSEEKRYNNGLNYSRMLYYDEAIAANIHLTKNLRSDIAGVATKNRSKVRRLMGII